MKIKHIYNEIEQLEHIHIFNSNISCKIFPNLGASLQELLYKDIPVIDGISIDSAGIADYANTYKSSLLFPFPNRVQDGIYIYNQEKYQLNTNEKALNNALHGLVFDKKFTLVKSEASATEAMVTLSFSPKETEKGFPFKYRFSVTYHLNIHGNVTVSFEAENTDEKPFPFGMGWHPYFISEKLENSTISFKGKDQFINSERNIPLDFAPTKLPESFQIKEQKFDDAFSLHKAEVTFMDTNYSIDLNFESNTGAYLQIYTPPHRKNIAIEPMTCPPDAFNNKYGLQVLAPKEKFVWKMDLKLKTNT